MRMNVGLIMGTPQPLEPALRVAKEYRMDNKNIKARKVVKAMRIEQCQGLRRRGCRMRWLLSTEPCMERLGEVQGFMVDGLDTVSPSSLPLLLLLLLLLLLRLPGDECIDRLFHMVEFLERGVTVLMSERRSKLPPLLATFGWAGISESSILLA